MGELKKRFLWSDKRFDKIHSFFMARTTRNSLFLTARDYEDEEEEDLERSGPIDDSNDFEE